MKSEDLKKSILKEKIEKLVKIFQANYANEPNED